ncbi:unnamed protein product [Lymnaea stagnalis]|uniref:Uncharacterized protein n=1 Tax=Lymnaea stagnalis TaxID=6523 RepID=A0AAV2IPV1_LYMST
MEPNTGLECLNGAKQEFECLNGAQHRGGVFKWRQTGVRVFKWSPTQGWSCLNIINKFKKKKKKMSIYSLRKPHEAPVSRHMRPQLADTVTTKYYHNDNE